MLAPHSNDGPIFWAIEPPPTWDEMRADGSVVVDAPDSLLAIYTGDLGSVVLACQGVEDESAHFVVLEASSIPAIVEALQKAHAEALKVSAQWNAKYDAAERKHMGAGGAACK